MILKNFSNFTAQLARARPSAEPAPDPRVLALSREFEESDPDVVKRALMLSQRGKVKDAVELLQQAADDNRDDSLRHLSALARIVTPSDPNQAVAAYRKILQVSPHDDAAARDLADLLVKLGRYGEAKALAEKLVADAADGRAKATANALAAIVFAHAGDRHRAEACFESASVNARTTATDRAPLVLLLAQAAEALGEQAKARELYADARRASDTARATNAYADAELGLGRIALTENDRFEAEQHFRQALAMRDYAGNLPGVADALVWTAFCRAPEEPDESEAIYQQALALYSRLDDTLGLITTREALSNIAARKGDSERAETLRVEAQNLVDLKGLAAAPRLFQL